MSASNASITLGAREIAHGLTVIVRVRGMKWWRLSMKAGLWLIRLGVWLGNLKFEVENAAE
jgi:hypothetical protein